MIRVQAFILPITLIASIAAIVFTKNFGADSSDVSSQPLIPPPPHIEHMTFGYNENVSDSLWLRVIQDMDYCDAKASGQTETKVAPGTGAYSYCHSELGWTYRMIDAITTLTPQFRMPYNHGATIMSITVGDKEGAKRIFDRGMEVFPMDWSLKYRAAYHYLYELHEPKKAADLLVEAGKAGAPGWVYALAAKTYSQEGQALLAKSVLESVLEEDPESKYADRFKTRMAELDKTIAEEASKRAAEEARAAKKSKRSRKGNSNKN